MVRRVVELGHARRNRITGVDGGAAGQQGVRHGGSAIVGQRAKQGVDHPVSGTTDEIASSIGSGHRRFLQSAASQIADNAVGGAKLPAKSVAVPLKS